MKLGTRLEHREGSAKDSFKAHRVMLTRTRSAWLLSVATLAGTLAVLIADRRADQFYRPLRVVARGLAEESFPRAARLDVVVLATLCVVVAMTVALDSHCSRPDRVRSHVVSVLIAVAIAIVGGLFLGPLTALLVPLAFLLVLWAGPRLADAAPADVQLPLTLGLAARILVAFGLGLYGRATHGGLPVLDDEESLHRAAVELAPILAAGHGDLQPAWWHLPSPYLSLLGSLYLVLGPDFTAVRILNAAVGTVAVALVFGIAKRTFGPAAARAAAWTVAFWPAVVLWSGSGLRESLFTTSTLLVPWLLTRRLTSPAWGVGLATAAVTLIVIGALRNYTAWVLALAAALGLASRRLALAGLLFVGVVAVWPRLPIAAQLTPSAIERQAAAIELATIPETDPAKRPPPPNRSLPEITSIVRAQLPGDTGLTTAIVFGYETDPIRYVIATDRDSFYVLPPERVGPVNAENVTWDVPLRRLLSGLRLLFLPPAPWGSAPVQRLATIPDALALDFLVALVVLSVWTERRVRSTAWVVSVVYLVVMIFGLAIISANLGTVFRHRGMLVPWASMLAAPLLVDLIARQRWVAILRSRSPSAT
ncbi:MAG TPA: glycosyltransferase family 39 protein [Chloroflexota bacterium]|nr:glycosyltransferase family 39 protein [Chloroflexota bacterium]